MREAVDLFGCQGLRGHRHRAVEVGRRLGLESTQKLQEILQILPGQPRDLLLSRQRRRVARRAVVSVDELASRCRPDRSLRVVRNAYKMSF